MRYFMIRYHLDCSLDELKWKKGVGCISDDRSYNKIKYLIVIHLKYK